MKPRACTICRHPNAAGINRDILNAVKRDEIMQKYGLGSHDTIQRHMNKCLGETVQSIVDDKKIRDVVVVYDELVDNLEFAKHLRKASMEYLSDPRDPLRITLIPRASEIDVVYYDLGDVDANGVPKKKTESLQLLLAELKEAGMIREAVRVKHVDIRAYALDCIAKIDACLDKFAKLAGLYQKDRKNSVDMQALSTRLYDELIKMGWHEDDARNYASSAYNKIEPASDAVN